MCCEVGEEGRGHPSFPSVMATNKQTNKNKKNNKKDLELLVKGPLSVWEEGCC